MNEFWRVVTLVCGLWLGAAVLGLAAVGLWLRAARAGWDDEHGYHDGGQNG